MSVHAEVVPQPMREESNTRPRLENLLLVALEDADGVQPVNGNLVGQKMDIVPHDALLQGGCAVQLHLQHDVVDLAGLLAELARDGEGTRLRLVKKGFSARHDDWQRLTMSEA